MILTQDFPAIVYTQSADSGGGVPTLPKQPPPNRGNGTRRKGARKILADCVFLASEGCQIATRLAPSQKIRSQIRKIYCGFVSAGIWAYAYQWRLGLQGITADGELQVAVQLQGNTTPLYRGILQENELDLLSRPVVAGYLVKPSRQHWGCTPMSWAANGPQTFTDGLAQLLTEIEDGIQICWSPSVVNQLRGLKREAASLAVSSLFHSNDFAATAGSEVDGEPLIELTLMGTRRSYRGQIHWAELDFEAGQLAAPLTRVASWKRARRQLTEVAGISARLNSVSK